MSKVVTNAVTLGQSGTASNNFLLDTDSAGSLRVRRGSDGSLGTVLTVNSAGTLVQPAQSMVRVQGANGFGSTNTVIRRFTNILTNQGADITYTDSATLGGSFTINTAGVYAISSTENISAGTWAGLTLNTTQPTVGISTITNTSEILDYNVQPNANYSISNKWTGYLAAGSVVRLHTDGTSAGTQQARGTNFTITRVA